MDHLRSFVRLLSPKFSRSNANMTPAMVSPSTEILFCDPSTVSFSRHPSLDVTSQNTLDALKRAARLLVDERQVVVFPTETVYGLGANALDAEAAQRIFTTKGRPADNPLIVHVSSLEMLHTILPKDYTISKTYSKLMDSFWPGALTLLFPAEPSIIPSIITAKQSTVAVRMPSHPVARALIHVAGVPLAAPSANSSGKPSPTRAEHVMRDLGAVGKVPLVLDGGPCQIGLESTVVDGLSDDGAIRVLRPGGVTVEDLERVLAEGAEDGEDVPKVLVHRRDYTDEAMEQAPSTPGMKYRHYSPSVPVVLVNTRGESLSSKSNEASVSFGELLTSLRSDHGSEGNASNFRIGVLAPSDSPLANLTASTGASTQLFPLGTLADPATSANRLFDGLLSLEKDGVHVILIEAIEEDREGLAFMNRVRKAAGESRWLNIP
jgi:L-threonylcarbamoyladenylate synthase